MSNRLETAECMLSYFSRILLAVLACGLALIYGDPAPGDGLLRVSAYNSNQEHALCEQAGGSDR